MSAINPASFVTPTSSLNVPPPFASIGVQSGRGSPAPRRRQQSHNLAQTSTAGGYADSADHARSLAAAQTTGLRNAYFNPYQGLDLGTGLQPHVQDVTGVPNPMYGHLSPTEAFTQYPGHHYAMLDPNAPSFSTSQRSTSRPSQGERSPGQEWMSSFQRLTLGGT